MIAPMVIAFTDGVGDATIEREAETLGAGALILCARANVRRKEEDRRASNVIARGRAVILLAIGDEGGAALARRVEEDGLDGVVAVVLVGVGAPWAERDTCGACAGIKFVRPSMCSAHRTPLGPIAPLRAVAARTGTPCRSCRWNGNSGSGCKSCRFTGHDYHLRFILAASPEAGVCAACGGKRGHILVNADNNSGFWPCESCSGTGRTLSSADVAAELAGLEADEIRTRFLYSGAVITAASAGITVVSYPTSAALDEHGLAAALKLALEGT